MNVRIINELDKLPPTQNCINLIPYGIFSEINFKRQLMGGAKDLVMGGKISKRLGGITLVGVDTDNCSIKRKSILVYEEGRLTSICDMNEPQEKYSPAFGYKIVNFSSKKIGVLVHKDVFLPDAIKSLVFCDCNAIIDLYAGLLTKKLEVSAEFYSYVYGIDFLICAKDKKVYFNPDGEQIGWTDKEDVELSCEKRYRDIKIKRRGARWEVN